MVDDPEFVMGDETFIGHACGFLISRWVQLGEHCLLAGGVQIQDHKRNPVDAVRQRAGEPSLPEASAGLKSVTTSGLGPALIIKGVTIGDRSIIGARAAVTREVPLNVVSAGKPARVVKELVRAEPVQS